MKSFRQVFASSILLAALLSAAGSANTQSTEPLELVISGGWVMDPETGLDAVRNVGIANGTIVAITEDPLEAPESIDATGLVVAPGFIDLHAHGQDPVSNRLQAADGVTTALEMEVGVYPVGEWLASREGKALIHYGATAGHWPARAKLMDGIDLKHLPTLPPEEQAELNKGEHAYREASAEELDKLVAMLAKVSTTLSMLTRMACRTAATSVLDPMTPWTPMPTASRMVATSAKGSTMPSMRTLTACRTAATSVLDPMTP